MKSAEQDQNLIKRIMNIRKIRDIHPAKLLFSLYSSGVVFFAFLGVPLPLLITIILFWSALWFWSYIQTLQKKTTRMVAMLNRFFLIRDKKVFRALDEGELATFGEMTGFKEVLFTLRISLPKLLDEIESYRKLYASFESLLREMNEGVILCEGDGKIRLINPIAQQILLMKSDEGHRSLAQLMRSRGILLPRGTGETEIYAKKLKKKIQFSIHAFADHRKIILFHDVTELRKHQNQIEEFRRLVMLGKITAGIAHEIKTPLTNVKLAFQLIQNGDRDPQTLKMVSKEIERLEHRIREFLSFARGHWAVETFDLCAVVDELVQMVSNTVQLRHIQVDVQSKKPEMMIRSSVSGVKTLLLNLLINAVDAARGTVKIKMRQGKKGIDVLIYDDGDCRLDDRDFEAFRSSKPSGTGLGLAIVQDVAFKINAQIYYRSTASFTLFSVGIRNQE